MLALKNKLVKIKSVSSTLRMAIFDLHYNLMSVCRLTYCLWSKCVLNLKNILQILCSIFVGHSPANYLAGVVVINPVFYLNPQNNHFIVVWVYLLLSIIESILLIFLKNALISLVLFPLIGMLERKGNFKI